MSSISPQPVWGGIISLHPAPRFLGPQLQVEMFHGAAEPLISRRGSWRARGEWLVLAWAWRGVALLPPRSISSLRMRTSSSWSQLSSWCVLSELLGWLHPLGPSLGDQVHKVEPPWENLWLLKEGLANLISLCRLAWAKFLAQLPPALLLLSVGEYAG